MSRKCACCDTHSDLTFVSNADDYYCMSCYYETYHRFDFEYGTSKCEEYLEDNIVSDETLRNAIEVFEPSTASQYGYLYGLKSELENGSLRND